MYERRNTQAALLRAEADVRLDSCYGRDHCFSQMAKMIQAKLKLLDHEIDDLEIDDLLPQMGDSIR